MIISLIFVALLSLEIVLSREPAQKHEKLLITVYYETKCPDSMKFIKNQLYPLYTQIPDYINLKFVPYGIAETIKNSDGSFTFICQHGPNECRGNKLHACVISKLPNAISSAFVNCSMSQQSPPDAGPLCSSILQIENEYPAIQDCVDGSEGSQLLNQNGLQTDHLSPSPYWVPWITYDGVFYSQDLDSSQENLVPVVCKHLNGQKPPICQLVFNSSHQI